MIDPSRNQGYVYSQMGDPNAHRDPRDAAEKLAATDEALRRKLRRQRIIGGVIALLVFALLAAFLIFRLLTQ